MWVALEPLPDFPGLHEAWTEERPYFERAYRANNQEVVRVRFTPQHVDTGITANIPVMPRAISLLASASLVDETGAVVKVGDRGIIRPARSFYQEVRPDAIDVDAFLLTIAGEQANELFAAKAQMGALSILVPPHVEPPAPAVEDAPAEPPAPPTASMDEPTIAQSRVIDASELMPGPDELGVAMREARERAFREAKGDDHADDA